VGLTTGRAFYINPRNAEIMSTTEAINGTIELACRIARGSRNRDNHRRRMLPIAGGLTPCPPICEEPL